MMIEKNQNYRIIFGLKVNHLRTEKGLSFAELAEITQMSISYLNEIVKGKKYPKEDKIKALAKALGTTEKELTSPELPPALAPVQDLLNSNFLNELPLELFGIELPKVVEIIANAPLRVGAFISTLVDLARNYALREENFYFGALRSFIEMNDNYFSELEQAAQNFSKQHKVPTTSTHQNSTFWANILEKKYSYKIIENGLANSPDLKRMRAVFLPKHKKLLLNGDLSERQRCFQFAKELGFNYLQITDRATTASLMRARTFDEALNHFKAGYFAVALLINQDSLKRDMEVFLNKRRWDTDLLVQMIERYNVTRESLLVRMSTLLPHLFGIKKLFILRMVHRTEKDKFEIDRELHLDHRHQPHSNGLDEHYCRRWLAITMLQKQEGNDINNIIGVQRSKYAGTSDEYLLITITRNSSKTTKRSSVTMGILIDENLHKKVGFLNDPNIPVKTVSTTCERCGIMDCAERAAAPTVIIKKQQGDKMKDALRQLNEMNE